jgi:hypothetical protein
MTIMLETLSQEDIQDTPETPDGFWNLKTTLTVIVHSAVLSSAEMERWFVSVNKFFHFASKHYFISKTATCFWCTLWVPKEEHKETVSMNGEKSLLCATVHKWTPSTSLNSSGCPTINVTNIMAHTETTNDNKAEAVGHNHSKAYSILHN